ncbi:MAG: HypC/HybG/HupF family hydrogenase formation chaperone [Actinobacteria bacterium]|nr:HypC/HybG/HupF family hydrogenase formation chaperone [Actinomycetota bacterium]
MCLAIPARIVNIDKNTALIESLGVEKQVDITLLPDAKKGDYVIVHAGFAIQVIDREEALTTQGYWKEWLDEEGNQ